MAETPVSQNSPLTLYNTATMQPEKLRSGTAEEAILKGTHDFQSGQTINVIGADGKPGGGVPSEKLRDYLEAGYRLETPFQKVVNDYGDDNDNFTGDLKVAAQKGLSEFALGIPETIADHLQNPLELAKRKRLYEDHTAASVIGSIAGGGAGLIYGAPIFKGAEIAGKLAGRTVQKGMAEALLKAGASDAIAQAASRSIVGKIPAAAAQFAVEGAAFTAPRALTEAAFGDIDAAGESMLMGVGVGALMGAGTSAVSPIARGIGTVYNKFVKRPITRLGEMEGVAAGVETGEAIAGKEARPKFDGMPSEQPSDILTIDDIPKESLVRRKNADEIDAISRELTGQDALAAMKSKNRFMQDETGKMLLRDTEKAIEGRKYIKDLNEGAEAKITKSLGLDEMRSRDVVAQEASEKFQNAVKEGFEPSISKFRQNDETLRGLELGDKEGKRIFDAVDSFARKEADRLRIPLKTGALDDVLLEANLTDVPNLDALSVTERYQQLKSFARDLKGKAGLGNKYAARTAELYDNVAEHMLDNLESFLARGAKGLGPEAEQLAAGALPAFKQARQEYAIQKANVKPIAKFFGISGDPSPEKLQKLLGDLDFTKVGNKFIKATKKDIENIAKFSPDIADSILAHQQAFFASQAQVGTRDGVSLARLTKNYKKAIEDGRGHIFTPEQHADFKKIITIQESLPASIQNFNPSGTVRGSEMHTTLGNIAKDIPFIGKQLAALADEQSDTLTSKMFQTAVESASIPATQKLMQQTGKILKEVDTAITKTLQNAPERAERVRVRAGSVLERMLNEGHSNNKKTANMSPQEMMQEYAKRSESFATNLETTQDKLDDAFGGFYHYGAPQAAGVAMNRATTAVQFLATKIPPLSKPSSPYDISPPRVPDSEIAAFERRLEVVQNPGAVANLISDGTLSKEHVETLAAVYPTLFGYMQQVANDRLAKGGLKKMPYQQQLKLSMLMGLDLHPSTGGDKIAGFQQTFQPPAPNQAISMGAGPTANNAQSLADRTQTPGQKGQMG